MEKNAQKQTVQLALHAWASDESSFAPEEVFTSDYQNHQDPDISGGVSTVNLKEWQEHIAYYHRIFSDSRVNILKQIATEEETIVTRWEITAVHTGEFMGLPPTGKHATWRGLQIDRFVNSKIAETWCVWDKYSLCAAIGLVTL